MLSFFNYEDVWNHVLMMLLKSSNMYFPAGAMIENVKSNSVWSKKIRHTTLCIFTYHHWFHQSILLKIKREEHNSPIQHFNIGPTLFQRCGLTLKKRWADVENEAKSDVGFSTLHNVDATVDKTLSRRCFNVVSTLVKAISKPMELVIRTDG